MFGEVRESEPRGKAARGAGFVTVGMQITRPPGDVRLHYKGRGEEGSARNPRAFAAATPHLLVFLQKVLQFQSRGTLMATSGACGAVGPRASPAGDATMGLVGVGLLRMSDESRLDEWLLVRLRHCLNSEKQ